MMTDTEIRVKGVQILAQYLGDIEMERFIALIQREPFDYTKWRQNILIRALDSRHMLYSRV